MNLSISEVAQVCHEANRAYCAVFGDLSQKPWGDADEWQRSSAKRGVEFALANPLAPLRAQHDAWMNVKLAEGWVYGQEKDPVKKTHPCLVKFEDLPAQQQAKDALFRALVAVLAPYISTPAEANQPTEK